MRGNTKHFPFSLRILNLRKMIEQKKDGISLLFVIRGQFQVKIENETYIMNDDDIVVINPLQYWAVKQVPDAGLIVILQVEKKEIEEVIKSNWTAMFNCNSVKNTIGFYQKKELSELRERLVLFLTSYFSDQKQSLFHTYGNFFSVISYLTECFHTNELRQPKIIEQISDDKILRVIEYMNENYANRLSLEKIAQKEYISYSYLSRIFKKKVGISFSDYLMEIRLLHAVEDLRATNTSIMKIAINNGFSSSKSFHKFFKQYFNSTPKKFRESWSLDNGFFVESSKLVSDYDEIEKGQALQELSKYVVENNIEDISAIKEQEVHVSTKKEGLMKRTTKRMLNVGKATNLISEVYKVEIQEALNEIEFDFIRIEGFYREIQPFGIKNEILSSYMKNDFIFDYLLGLSLTPIISFKPEGRDEVEQQKWYEYQILSIEHLINRYGLTAVSKWRFEWEITQDSIEKNMSLFHSFYQKMSFIFQKVNMGIYFNCTKSYESIPIVENYLKFLSQYSLQLTFFSYNANLLEWLHGDKYDYLLLENFQQQIYNQFQELLKKFGQKQAEICLNEWNTLVGEGEVISGTFFRSALIIKDILSLSDRVSVIGYWINIEGKQNSVEKKQRSCLSLYLYLKIRRPLFFVLSFFDRIKGELIYQNERASVFRYEDEIFLLIYNNCIVDPALTISNSYIQYQSLKLNFCLSELSSDSYLIKKYTLDKDHGGVYNDWVRVGGITGLDCELMSYLEKKVIPKIELDIVDTVNQVIMIDTKLSFNACQLIHVRPLS